MDKEEIAMGTVNASSDVPPSNSIGSSNASLNAPLISKTPPNHGSIPEEPTNVQQPSSKFFVFILSFLTTIGGFLFGYDTGVISGAMLLMKVQFDLDTFWQELLVAIALAAAAIFAVLSGYTNDKLGRKPTILLSSFLFTAGSVLLALAVNRLMLLMGRVVVGAAIGFTSMTVPLYISECAPVHLRGRLVTWNNLCVAFGQFIAYCVDGIFSYDLTNGWRFMLGLAGVPSAMQFFSFLFMPETPRLLVKKGECNKARVVLQKLRASHDVNEELNAIQDSCRLDNERIQSKGGQLGVFLQMFKTVHVRRALFLGCGLQFFQQFIGINTLMYYSATIVQMTGIGSTSESIWISAGVAFVNFSFSFVGVYLVERIGRRPLSIGSAIGVFFSLVLVAAGFLLTDILSSDQYAWVIVVGLALYLAFFAPGMGPLPWTINSEIYPLWARSTAISTTTTVNWISNLVISLTFLTLCDVLTKEGAFTLYAAFTLFCVAFLVIFLPETKGKRLEEVEELFSDSQWTSAGIS